MPLYEFLEAHRSEILDVTRHRIAANNKGDDEQVLDSIPELYDDIVGMLRNDAGLERETDETAPEKTATGHGGERLKLGYTISELVHDYGAVCQAITIVAENSGDITPQEFRVLNQALDVAIAAAVTEYSHQRELEHERIADERATARLGFLAHELRNAISAAILAFNAIRRGEVGMAGRTSNVLERNLTRLRELIDRSLTEVRLRSDAPLSTEPTRILPLLEEVDASTALEAATKSSRIVVHADAALQAPVDRHIMVSAVTNLLLNAIKYSPGGAEIHLRGLPSNEPGGGVRIEVEDECGGLPEGRAEQRFQLFARGAKDGTGLGLGLAIARRAVEAHGGHIDVRNLPDKGCVFSIELPRKRPSP